MRFEIKTGGAFLIFISLVVLSGAVFGLGLVAGYEMAQKNQPDLSQTSTTYPLPSAPPEESKPPPVAEMSAPAGAPTFVPDAHGVAAVPPAPHASSYASPHASPAAVAGMKPPASPSASRPAAPNPAPEEEEADSGPAPSPAVAAPASARRPYNIQIEAVMDKSAADEMVSRLKTLGYNAQELTTTVNAQIMYRVRVGPYGSAEEASAAQDKLREQYRQAYTTSH